MSLGSPPIRPRVDASLPSFGLHTAREPESTAAVLSFQHSTWQRAGPLAQAWLTGTLARAMLKLKVAEARLTRTRGVRRQSRPSGIGWLGRRESGNR
jgi:hypothetical protein